MKQFILFSILASCIPITMLAQDDLYFTPSKNKTQYSQKNVDSKNYYSGINKSEDEYNRRYRQGDSYQMLGKDSLQSDMMQFRDGDSTFTDTGNRRYKRYYDTDEDDFAYSRRMGRFEGFWGWYDPWFIGRPYYYIGWRYYDPWYSDWYDPWYYGYRGYYGYYGWTSPWRYNRYAGWSYP